MQDLILAAAALLVVLIVWGVALIRRWGDWGSTPTERSAEMPGDAYFTDRQPAFVQLTRAISIAAPPDVVWPWLAQLGRGAGWYSYDRLDNGGRMSARHIVSWIPAPQVGDASPIGYLCHIRPGEELTWWAPGTGFMGATARLAVDIRLSAEPTSGRRAASRLVIRMSADAAGRMGRVALWGFRFIDSIMARRQLLGIRQRAEVHGVRRHDPDHREATRDQFQLYETIFASGERAGKRGKEHAERWRAAAVEAGLVAVEAGNPGAGRRTRRRQWPRPSHRRTGPKRDPGAPES